MTTETSVTRPAHRKLPRAAKAGAAVTAGAILLTSFAGLAGWEKTVIGEDTTIQSGSFQLDLAGEKSVFDVTAGNKAGRVAEIDVDVFKASPGDVLRILQPLTVTKEGENAKGYLSGAAPHVSGDLPLQVETSLVDGDFAAGDDLASADVVARTEAGAPDAIVDFGRDTGLHEYTVVQEVTFPIGSTAPISTSGVVSGSGWMLRQYTGEPPEPAEDLGAAWILPDPAVNAAVRSELGVDGGYSLTLRDAKKITTYLDIGGVTDLTGLNRLRGISLLVRDSPELASLEPLSGARLDEFSLVGETKVAEFVPLASITTLRNLNLGAAKISSLAPLSDLEHLEHLSLTGTQVTDLGPLSGLQALRDLDISDTQVASLEPLGALQSLSDLRFENTPLTDLGPLSGVNTLTSLYFSGTPVADLSPLSGLSNLTFVDADGTSVTDWSPVDHVANVYGRP